ncbi:MAG TPA: DUF4249 domain-containing protein [Bacteroidales bacterium]|nr:DUF4249 domain-containing protein [Bacteroidales bacterium]
MIKNSFLTVILVAFLLACTEEIDVSLDSTYARLVVDGSIADDSATYRISLSQSADYFLNEPAPRVSGATVRINDGTGLFDLHETEPGLSGIYETDSGFQAVPGKLYTLLVDLKEPIAGMSACQASCYLRPVTNLDSVSALFHPDWGPEGVWTIKLWAQEPGNEVNYYMFNLYRNGKLLTDTITKKVVSDDKYINGSYMNGVDVMYLNHAHKWETIFPGDTIILQMSGITEEYFNFISQVQQAGYNIPFFTGPPANVTGNISDGGIGFFAAFSNTYARNTVKN